MRFLPGIGLGEILLALVIFFSIYSSIINPDRLPKLNEAVFPYSINFYVFTIFFLITAINFYLETKGTIFRDFFAYALSALMLFSLALHKDKVKDIATLLVHFSVLVLAFQYFFGDQSNFDIKSNDPQSFERFKAGANNPNQLALYLVCLITISCIVLKNNTLKIIYLFLFAYVGLLTFSDALLAFLAVSLTSYFFLIIIPRRHIYIGITGYTFLMIFLLSIFFDSSFNFISEQFQERDQGNARFILYRNGLLAWLDNPISIIFGNGAGNFSGLYGPFGLFEAHSGPIDTLAMGGLVGFIILFFFPVRFVFQAFKMQEKLLFSLLLGLLFFCLFHFLLRHPIYWFTLFVVYIYIEEKLHLRKKCVD